MALVEHLDDAIGRVLETLQETGRAASTLVVFTSDNGGSRPHAQNNDPWRDGKQSHYEGGLRYGGNSYEAIIRGDWKLLRNDPYSPLELYHLQDDPREQHNLAATHPKVVNELATALRAHLQRGGATPWQQP